MSNSLYIVILNMNMHFSLTDSVETMTCFFKLGLQILKYILVRTVTVSGCFISHYGKQVVRFSQDPGNGFSRPVRHHWQTLLEKLPVGGPLSDSEPVAPAGAVPGGEAPAGEWGAVGGGPRRDSKGTRLRGDKEEARESGDGPQQGGSSELRWRVAPGPGVQTHVSRRTISTQVEKEELQKTSVIWYRRAGRLTVNATISAWKTQIHLWFRGVGATRLKWVSFKTQGIAEPWVLPEALREAAFWPCLAPREDPHSSAPVPWLRRQRQGHRLASVSRGAPLLLCHTLRTLAITLAYADRLEQSPHFKVSGLATRFHVWPQCPLPRPRS